MYNLLRMDRYRMFRSKMFLIALAVILGLSIASAPIERALAGFVAGEALSAPAEADFAALAADPFAYKGLAMFIFLAAVSFFYADLESGYIKNIAGQQPKRSRTVISKFITVMFSNLVLMLAALGGRLISAYIVGTVKFEGGTAQAVYTFFVRWLLLLAVSAVLLFLAAGLRMKSLANVVAVLGGTGLLVLVYLGADTAIARFLKLENFSIAGYAPDQLLQESAYEGPKAVIVALVFIVVFVFLSVRIVDRTDVK